MPPSAISRTHPPNRQDKRYAVTQDLAARGQALEPRERRRRHVVKHPVDAILALTRSSDTPVATPGIGSFLTRFSQQWLGLRRPLQVTIDLDILIPSPQQHACLTCRSPRTPVLC